MSNSSIWHRERTLSVANTPGQSRPGSDGSEGVHYIFEATPSECLEPYPGHSLQGCKRCHLLPQRLGHLPNGMLDVEHRPVHIFKIFTKPLPSLQSLRYSDFIFQQRGKTTNLQCVIQRLVVRLKFMEIFKEWSLFFFFLNFLNFYFTGLTQRTTDLEW